MFLHAGLEAWSRPSLGCRGPVIDVYQAEFQKQPSPLHMRRVAALKIFWCGDAVDVWPRPFRRGGQPPPHLRFARPDENYLVPAPVRKALSHLTCDMSQRMRTLSAHTGDDFERGRVGHVH